MDILNRIYSILRDSNGAESSIRAQYEKEEAIDNQIINKLSTNPQYISLLKSINEIRNNNGTINNSLRNDNTLDSITIPSSSDIGLIQNEQNVNFSMDNMVQNQITSPNLTSNVDVANNLNLYNQNSQISTSGINFNSQLNTNLINGLNGYSSLNLNSNISPIQMNESSTLPLSQDYLNLISTPLSTSITNSLLEKSTLNNEIKKQIQMLYIEKLLKNQQQLLANNKISNKFNSMIIPSGESDENIITNNLVNNFMNNFNNKSITIPSTEPEEYGFINNSIVIPSCDPNENVINSNLINDSITIPNDNDNKYQNQLSDDLLKQFQLQEQLLAAKINEISNETEISNECEIGNKFMEIPTITINNEKIDLLKSPNDENGTSFDSFMKVPLNSKQNVINNYTPLSPELSPYLNNAMNSDKMVDNYVKKSEYNTLSSMNTLNSILSITPQMEPENSPLISNNIDSFNTSNNQNVNLNGFFDPLKAINNEIEDNSDNLLVNNNDLLNVPATPKSISGSPNPNDCTLTDINFDSIEIDSLINSTFTSESDEVINEICNKETEYQKK